MRVVRALRGPDYATSVDPSGDRFRRLALFDDAEVVVDELEAGRLVAGADVVLIGDVHPIEPCRLAFARIVARFASPAALAQGHVGIALEAVPRAKQEQFDLVRRREGWAYGAEIRDLLREGWGWSAREYPPIFADPALAPVAWIAAGGHTNEPKPARELRECDRIAAEAICDWLEIPGGGGRKVFVLYGLLHLVGKECLPTEIARRGHTVVSLVPFWPPWEVAIRRRSTPDADRRWYQVAPGLLRAPFVTSEDLRAIDPDRDRLDETRRSYIDYPERLRLLAELGSGDWAESARAAEVLGNARSPDAALLQALANQLGRPSSRIDALAALTRLAERSDSAAVVLARVLREQVDVRLSLLAGAGAVDALEFLDAVRESMLDRHEDRLVRAAAAFHLARRFADPETVVAVLTDLVADPDGYERTAATAAWHLGRYGLRASAALPALRAAEQSWDPDLARAARSAAAQVESSGW